ncbi:MAG TPA: hypothetical protein VMV20_05670 [Chitinophagaceae bacterium]|nr:hypothetical protein [Chitinophagaceae bacterium]
MKLRYLPAFIALSAFFPAPSCIHLDHPRFDVIGRIRGIRDTVVYFTLLNHQGALVRSDTVPVREGGVIEYTGKVKDSLRAILTLPSLQSESSGNLSFELLNTNYLIHADADSINKAVIHSGNDED